MLIEIGRPCQASDDAQIFRVVPDTGSSDLWVPASNCSRCSGHRFNIAKSCSAKSMTSRVHFKYGDGTVASGTGVIDTVKVGDVKVRKQFFIQVDYMDATSMAGSDGILGLAHHYEHGSHIKEGMTFMASLFAEHPDMVQQFSLRLTGMNGEPSKIIFGDPRVKHYAKEPFIYGKAYYMSHTALWLTSVYSIGLSKTGVERVFPTRGIIGTPALVDSGSSLIVLMPDVWDDLIKELGNHLLNCRIEDTDGSLAMCNCPEEFHKIPALVINVIDQDNKERPLCMAADEYILKSVDPVTGRSNCVPAIQRGNRHQPVPLIFGMTFMRAFYTNFDIKNHRIGFARSALSSMPAGADCTVHNKEERQFWIGTTAFVVLAVSFAIYLCCCGDINACCGWPSFEVTKPCCGYQNLEAMGQPIPQESDLQPGVGQEANGNSVEADSRQAMSIEDAAEKGIIDRRPAAKEEPSDKVPETTPVVKVVDGIAQVQETTLPAPAATPPGGRKPAETDEVETARSAP